MKISFIILTHNRRDDLLRTLDHLMRNPPAAIGGWECVVVDNASTDDTSSAVSAKFPEMKLVVRSKNVGSVARNAGVARSAGEYLVFLDDDSYPLGDTVQRSVEYLDAHPAVALVGGRVFLPDGQEDASALPIIMPACALCVRRLAFEAVGGFCKDFFRQAEEYDLIFKLLHAGWDVQRFEDLHYRHEKVPRSRSSELILSMDLQNNLLLLSRYVPLPWRGWLEADWLQRYSALLNHAGFSGRIGAIVDEAQRIIADEAGASQRVLSDDLIERIFMFDEQHRSVHSWAAALRIRKVVIADYSKNVHATWRAARLAGLEVVAIADSHPAYAELCYRGIPIVPDDVALARGAQGIVVSTINPAQVERRAIALRRAQLPVLTLWQGKDLPPSHALMSITNV